MGGGGRGWKGDNRREAEREKEREKERERGTGVVMKCRVNGSGGRRGRSGRRAKEGLKEVRLRKLVRGAAGAAAG